METIIMSSENKVHKILLNGQIIDQIKNIKDFGIIIEKNGSINKEVDERIVRMTRNKRGRPRRTQ